MYSYVLCYSYYDNFYGVLLPDSEDWLAQSEYIENAFLEARNSGEKVAKQTWEIK